MATTVMSRRPAIPMRTGVSTADRVGEFAGDIAAHFARSWVLMLVIGMAHHEINPAIPPIGYWVTVILLLGFDSLVTWPIHAGVRRGAREAAK